MPSVTNICTHVVCLHFDCVDLVGLADWFFAIFRRTIVDCFIDDCHNMPQ